MFAPKRRFRAPLVDSVPQPPAVPPVSVPQPALIPYPALIPQPSRFAPACFSSFHVRRAWCAMAFVCCAALPANAVVLIGRVTDPLGRGIPGARVQLVENGKVVALGYAGANGAYEVRSGDAGRFTLLGSAGG